MSALCLPCLKNNQCLPMSQSFRAGSLDVWLLGLLLGARASLLVALGIATRSKDAISFEAIAIRLEGLRVHFGYLGANRLG